MSNLAATYDKLGRWKDSENICTCVLESQERLLSRDHPSTLQARANLASIFIRFGRCAAAEAIQTSIYMSAKNLFGEKHLTSLSILSNFSWTSTSVCTVYNLKLGLSNWLRTGPLSQTSTYTVSRPGFWWSWHGRNESVPSPRPLLLQSFVWTSIVKEYSSKREMCTTKGCA